MFPILPRVRRAGDGVIPMNDAGFTYGACHFLIMLERDLAKVASGQDGKYMISCAACTRIFIFNDVPLICIN
ncbi:hypothetical protein ABE28_005235 [Peribacillus muralis]|uniref:Uncharacterized protein n=1 Tax=Peribacillus muralis TaxID=264697 RepID=A0A1B3XKJ9_9BACI|nr:hypothetical protein ABE28_005235 [Peribacillus muralis]